jgi:hypothetical protein
LAAEAKIERDTQARDDRTPCCCAVITARFLAAPNPGGRWYRRRPKRSPFARRAGALNAEAIRRFDA